MSNDDRPFGWGYDKAVAKALAAWSHRIGDTETLALCERVKTKDPEAADEVHRRWARTPWLKYTKDLTDDQVRERFAPGGELAEQVRAAVFGMTDLGQIGDAADQVYEQEHQPLEEADDGAELVVWVGRSVGVDGAVLVVIDTEGFEPNGSTPGQPALRVAVNDSNVYAGVEYDPGDGAEHPLGEADWQEYRVPLSAIAYPPRE